MEVMTVVQSVPEREVMRVVCGYYDVLKQLLE
jgi:hypothetical protein